MRQSFILSLAQDEISLRTSTASDCENLRLWKNENRFSFFFQEIITPQMQEVWFKQYLERENDYMFVVQYLGEVIGCMGFRLIDEQADVYNVILGKPEYGGKGIMGKAIALMCRYILQNMTQDIRLKVLRSNPTVKWYLKNRFREIAAPDNYFELKFDPGGFAVDEFQKVNSKAF